MDEQSIFLAALEKGTPRERSAFLAEACGSDEELRHELELLIKAHHKAGDFLQDAPIGIDQPIAEKPGSQIGPYKLLEQIGEGGFGIVFVAEQQQPVRRKVALKLIKPGMDTRQVIARFEAERQALAMMDHLNIAKVLDAGATESGRPYFVMELVHGTPITTYCDANELTPRERLQLFISVCQAIHHAHRKGIIHRDIKPGNILVTMYDDRPVPKVIDFGIAKAVEQRLTEKTIHTHFGTMVGTIEYASPEQAEMNAYGVDTRSDVYSLGVLLYELLTGTTPLDRNRLRDSAYGELVRLVKEEEAIRPSVRLSNSATLLKVAAARRTDPAKLSSQISGELDWIVMRCLEKDRTRRYDGASSLARDLQRYLSDAPVEACPPTLSYRLRKAYARHRGAVLTAGSIAATLILATVISLGFAIKSIRSERAARRQESQARTSAEKARASEAVARKHLDEANAARRDLEIEREKLKRLNYAALYATFAGARSKPGGRALAFDGNGTRVTGPHIPFDEYETFTIEAWVRGWKGALMTQGTAGDPENNVWLAVGTHFNPYETCGWESASGTNHQVTMGGTTDRVGWNHLAMVYDGERQNLFMNGKLRKSNRAPPPGRLVGKRLLQIGAHDRDQEQSEHGTGLLGPIRISRSVRYSEPFEPNWTFTADSDTVLLYDLAEGEGSRLQDSSGNGNDAFVQGPRWFNGQDVFSLNFRSTQVTDRGLEQLSKLQKLEILSLEWTAVTDAGLEHLKGLRSLKYLDLRNTAVTDVGMKQIRTSLPRCKIVGSAAEPTSLNR